MIPVADEHTVLSAVDAVLRDVGDYAAQVAPVFARRVNDAIDLGEDAEWIRGLPPGQSRWVLTVGLSETALDEADSAAILAYIASSLQDAVIDITGRPWPDIPGVGVLDPEVVDGVACWARAGVPYASIGSLQNPQS